MTMLTSLKTGGRAAIVALVMGATAMTAMPAQAQGLNFSFHFGNGSPFGGPGVTLNYGGKNKACLSDKQIAFQLMRNGWDHVRTVNGGKFKAIYVAERKGKWFQILVDRCTGKTTVQPVKLKKKPRNNTDFDITLRF